MKRIYGLLLATTCLLSTGFLHAAWVVTYTMTPSQPAYSAITGTGTQTTINDFGFCPDQTVSPVIPIGFTFQFDGTNYTQCVATDNGLLIFGNNSGLSTCGGNVGTPTDIPNNLADVNIPRPFLAPLWEELQFMPTSPFGSGSYRTTGPVGSRIFVMEWCKMSWRAPTNTDQISFQVMLYEGSNIIDFNYFQGPTALGTLPTASIGLGAISPGTYYSLNNSTNTAVASSSSNNSGINVKPATNQRYRWTPSTSLPVQLVSFWGYNEQKENILGWSVATQLNNDYFTLKHSQNGTSFTEVTRVDGAGSCSQLMHYTATDHFPFPGITYYELEWTDFNGLHDHSYYIAISSDTSQPALLYPNPASSAVNVAINEEQLHYVILDTEGRLVQEGELEKGTSIIDISGMTKGIYFLVAEERKYKIVVAREE